VRPGNRQSGVLLLVPDDPGIDHLAAEQIRARPAIAHLHRNTPPAGVFDRIGEQVEENLAKFAFIPAHIGGQRGFGLILKMQRLFLGL